MGHRLALLLCAVALTVALTGCPEPAGPLPATPRPTPVPTPAPPTPPPAPYVPNKRLETGRIFNGMQYRVTLETEHGASAAAERNDPSSYAAEVTVRVKVPKPHKDLAAIAQLNDRLPAILPTLPALLETAQISPHYDDLYRRKVANLQASLNRLDTLLTRHNFFDCETVLDLQHPETKRRAVLVQADMDVDGDGSDADRVPEIDGSSSTFQPFTSYKWGKKGTAVNSFIPPREAKLSQIEQELAAGGVSPMRSKELKEAQARLKSEISDLKKYSFLVAATDPFIVLPGSMFGSSKGPFAPMVGDYCVVIFGGVLYPTIVGDVGPSFKQGEGSLRLCKQLNDRSNSANRPVSDLKVTYLVFPGTADKPFDVPDLGKWRTRCEKLLEELGGHQGELFTWEDLSKPKVPPVAPDATAPATLTPATTPLPTTTPPTTTPPPTSTPSPAPTTPPATPPPAATAS